PPVRLPATASSPEIFLVLSAERDTLKALDAETGEAFWGHRLSAPCLGRPVIIKNRVHVPTTKRRIEELEIFSGTQLGYDELHHPSAVGGFLQEATGSLYLPADSRSVYVLDVAQRRRVALLETGHPAGSLRAEPILVNRYDPLRKADAAGAIP